MREIITETDRVDTRGVREPENIGNPMVGTSRIPKNFEIPKRIGFPEKVEIPENFENLAIVSRTTLHNAVQQPAKYVNTQYNFFCQWNYWKHGF